MLQEPVRVGLLDSGVGPRLRDRVLAHARFEATADGDIVESPMIAAGGHGGTLAAIIAALAPRAAILDAQVFNPGGRSSPAVVAAGLEWLVRNGARVVNMSFGLVEDREALRCACESARQAGVAMFAAMPARGKRVFPAAYPEIIRVSADGRCGHREISVLDGLTADFGASPFPPQQYTYGRVTGGTSYAVAHVAAMAAAWLAQRPGASAAEIHSYLTAIACHSTPIRTAKTAGRRLLSRG